ncbi:MAG: hypothetical protein H6613_18475 [Ignavibacteriales bacterium]|nr:hypothetical protein [Ignavibacteriales bacterium]
MATTTLRLVKKHFTIINQSNNIAIGSSALYSVMTGSGNIALGHEAGKNATGSNQLYIENSSSNTPLIGGNFAADEIYLNGKVGIGETSPAKLHI